MIKPIALWSKFTALLNTGGEFLPQLGLRLLLAYEFWEAGVMKFGGENWFAQIQDQFPLPFSVLPAGVSWFLATWSELLGAVGLAFGFGTRLFSLILIILTVVAWASVHAGNGYNVCDNGYKLPLMYLILFLPLLFTGAGKLSVDHWLAKRLGI